jgi:hypothetical protein
MMVGALVLLGIQVLQHYEDNPEGSAKTLVGLRDQDFRGTTAFSIIRPNRWYSRSTMTILLGGQIQHT